MTTGGRTGGSTGRWAAASDAVGHVLVDGDLADEIVVDGTDGHHLQRVRRLGVGEVLTAGDGTGGWRPYEVVDAGGGWLAAKALQPVCREPTLEPSLAVAFALTKGDKPESVVARCTEMGVDRVVPVAAERSVVRWGPSREASAAERLARVAREACMQCRRSRLTVLEPLQSVGDLAGRPGLVVADRSGMPASEIPEPGPDGWLLLVGPEGGWSEAERALMGDAPQLAVGPHVLRAETAAVAGAAALTGRRRVRPPGRS